MKLHIYLAWLTLKQNKDSSRELFFSSTMKDFEEEVYNGVNIFCSKSKYYKID